MDQAIPVSQIGPSLKAKVFSLAAHSWTKCNQLIFAHFVFSNITFLLALLTFFPPENQNKNSN